MAAVMRFEKAEAAAVAAQNELLDVTKRCVQGRLPALLHVQTACCSS